MAFNYKLPKIQELDGISILNTPVDGVDDVLASGVLTILDENGGEAIKIKASDLLGFRYDAYTTGTASAIDVDFSGATLVNNSIYSLTVSAPYVQNFFGGGQETKAVYIPRTYTVSTDASATVQELLDAFLTAINSDASAYFSASDLGGGVLEITAASALAGELFVETSAPGSVISTATAWVAPVGSIAEVLRYVNNAALVTGQYDRFIIEYRKVIRHNAVSGLGVIKKATALVYLDTLDGGTAATVATITSILDGSYATVADYLGCPAI